MAERFHPAPLSQAGRPVPLEQEVEIKNIEEVSVLKHEQKKIIDKIFHGHSIVLTNLRLIVICQSDSSSNRFIGWGLHLKTISHFEDCAKLFGTSTRISLYTLDGQLELGLKFHKTDKNEFTEVFSRVLAKKSWETISRTMKPTATVFLSDVPEEKIFSHANAGVNGIIRRQEQALQSVDNIAKSALSDLEALMRSAKEVIDIVQRYAKVASTNISNNDDEKDSARSETSSQSGGGEVNEMETIMQNIGIVSPVTKFSAGRSYHKLLARQIADLLLHQNRLERLGGLITLTDLYCIFNRARGTEVVSPDDMLCACEHMERLQLGMALRVFESGVKVLQADSASDDAISREIDNLLTENIGYRENGIQISELSHHLHISFAIAKEILLLEEQRRRVCRDESIHGLSFFKNTLFI